MRLQSAQRRRSARHRSRRDVRRARTSNSRSRSDKMRYRPS